MASHLRARFLVVLSVFCAPGARAQDARETRPVLAQNIAPNVLWTRRADRCTLQILTSWRVAAAYKGGGHKPFAPAARELPDFEVWLLKKDGGAIPAYQRWQTPAAKAGVLVRGEPRAEVQFSYSLSAGAEAVAFVICADGDCIVRKVAPFPM